MVLVCVGLSMRKRIFKERCVGDGERVRVRDLERDERALLRSRAKKLGMSPEVLVKGRVTPPYPS